MNNLLDFGSSSYVSRQLGVDDNVNSYSETNYLINTLVVNLILFVVILILFELTRGIKLIFLKRLNTKFISTKRVPPEPPSYPFAWIYTISQVSDDDLVRMVGLDAYMLLRYIIVCFR